MRFLFFQSQATGGQHKQMEGNSHHHGVGLEVCNKDGAFIVIMKEGIKRKQNLLCPIRNPKSSNQHTTTQPGSIQKTPGHKPTKRKAIIPHPLRPTREETGEMRACRTPKQAFCGPSSRSRHLPPHFFGLLPSQSNLLSRPAGLRFLPPWASLARTRARMDDALRWSSVLRHSYR